MNKQERQGKVETIVGQAKQTAGAISGNKSLEHEGERQEARGKLRERLGSARSRISRAINRWTSARSQP